MKKIIIFFFVMILLWSSGAAGKIKLKGSRKIGYNYTDINYPVNNTSYNENSTIKFDYVGLGNLWNSEFAAVIKADYNKDNDQEKLDPGAIHFEFKKENRSVELGEFYNQFSEFTINNQKIEGLNFFRTEKLNKEKFIFSDINIGLYGGISNRDEELTSKNSTVEYRQWMYGTRLQLFSERYNGVLGLTLLHARDDDGSIDTGTPEGPIEDLVMGLNYEMYFFKEKLKMTMEYANSKYDDNFNDTIPEYKDDAYKIGVVMRLTPELEVMIENRHIGYQFYTSGNTSLNTGLKGYKGNRLNIKLKRKQLVLTEEIELYKENLGADTQTKYSYFTTKAQYDVDKKNKLDFEYSLKKIKRDFGLENKEKNKYKIGYKTLLGQFKISSKLNYDKSDNKISPDKWTKNLGYSISVTNKMLKNRLYNMVYYLWNENKSIDNKSEFSLITINSSFMIIPKKLTTLNKASYKISKSATNTKTYQVESKVKYIISMEKNIDLTYKKDKTVGGTTDYDVDMTELYYTVLF